MANTLNIASEIDAYTISDKGTWLSFKNKKKYLGLLAGRFGRISFLWGIIFRVGSSGGYDRRHRDHWALTEKPGPSSLEKKLNITDSGWL